MLASSLLGAVHGVCPVNVVCRPGFGCKLASTRYHLQRRQCRNLRQQDRHEAVITAAASASTQTGALQLSQNLPDSREQAVRLATAPQHTEAWPSKILYEPADQASIGCCGCTAGCFWWLQEQRLQDKQRQKADSGYSSSRSNSTCCTYAAYLIIMCSSA